MLVTTHAWQSPSYRSIIAYRYMDQGHHALTDLRATRSHPRRPLASAALIAGALAAVVQAADGDVWGTQWGTRRADIAFALASAADGSLYVGSQFMGVLDAAQIGGTGTLDAAGRSTGLVVAFDRDGRPKWQRVLPAAGGLEVRAAAAGPEGLVVAGHFLETMGIEENARRSSGGADLFIEAYAPGGASRWTHTLGGKSADAASAVAVLDDGRSAVAAEFQLSARFGEAEGEPRVLTSLGDRDVVLLELDRKGDIERALQLGGAGRDQVLGLAAQRDGAYLALIGYEGSIAIDTAQGQRRFEARGAGDALLLRIETEKGIVAAVNVGIDGPEGWYAFAAHPDGSAWLATTISHPVGLQVGNAHREFAPRGSDALVMRLAPDFGLERAELLGGEGTESAERLLALPDGGALLGATFNAPLRVAGRALKPDGTDVVVVRYDARVRARGAEIIGGPKVQQVTGLAAMPGGRYAILGLYEDTLRVPRRLPLVVAGEKRAGTKAVGKTDVFLLVRALP